MSDYDTDSGKDSEEIIFDPNQDSEEKRVLRRDYRSLHKRIIEHQRNLEELSPLEIMDGVRTANSLFDFVKEPQEAILDSRFFVMATSIGAQKARAMKSGTGTFNVDNFITSLVRYMGRSDSENLQLDDSDSDDDGHFGPALDWDGIGRKCMAKSRRVPATGFMYVLLNLDFVCWVLHSYLYDRLGPLSVVHRKRARKSRSKLEKNQADRRKPQELGEENILRSENETTNNMAIMEGVLKFFNVYANNPKNLFELVINPTNFAHSVENLFYLSFLVRDGKVHLESRDGEPVVFLQDPGSTQNTESTKRKQMVLELDNETWKRAIQVFNIDRPFIPERPPVEAKLGDEWYGQQSVLCYFHVQHAPNYADNFKSGLRGHIQAPTKPGRAA
uniref:Non-structural maintenance of chromosomes element 4 n=1 Tax=Psilocybe cubensis TaxID=181762 RepID=A0A8H7Y965_PSICU